MWHVNAIHEQSLEISNGKESKAARELIIIRCRSAINVFAAVNLN